MKQSISKLLTIIIALSVLSQISGFAQAESQLTKLRELRKIDPTIKIRWDEKTDTPARLAGKLSERIDADAKEIAMRIFKANETLFKMTNPQEELKSIDVKKGPHGWQHVRFQQIYAGLPVEGKTILVHINKNNGGYAVTADYLPGIKLDTSASIRPSAAINAARADLNPKKPLTQAPKAQLVIYSYKEKTYLAWKTVLVSEDPLGDFIYYVDAHRGNVIHSYNDLKFALDRRTYDAERKTSLPGTLRRSEGQGAVGDTALDAAHENAGDVYDYYNTNHGRDSYDNAGAAIRSSVHYSEDYNNAAWSDTRQQMIYGDGNGTLFSPLSLSLDVVAHELTHAVTDNTSGLIYENQSGALNESLSDIFAILIDPDDWLLGEDVFTPDIPDDALRYFDDPPRGGQPDHMDDFVETDSDNGGVHINSGIPNKAAYLMAEGGAHRCVNVSGMGRIDMGRVFYETQINWLLSSSNFEDARDATVSAVGAVFPGDPSRLRAVEKAWAAVGIGVFQRLATATAGRISQIAIVPLGVNRVLTAMRDGSNNLRLIAWDVSETGDITRRGTATAGRISQIATVPLGANRVLTAMRDGSNDLRLIAWDVSETGDITRRGTATAGEISQIAITALDANRVVAAMRDGGNNLRLIAWDVSETGDITRRGTATAGEISRIAITPLISVTGALANRVVTAMRDGSNNLRLIAWGISGEGDIARCGTVTAGEISQIAIIPLGANRVAAAMRDGGNNLRLIPWDVIAD